MKKYFYIILLLLTMLNVYTVFAYGKSDFKEKTLIVEKMVVKPGDTLWDIAKKTKSDKADIREYIYEIQKINSMESSAISPGDIILVPVN